MVVVKTAGVNEFIHTTIDQNCYQILRYLDSSCHAFSITDRRLLSRSFRVYLRKLLIDIWTKATDSIIVTFISCLLTQTSWYRNKGDELRVQLLSICILLKTWFHNPYVMLHLQITRYFPKFRSSIPSLYTVGAELDYRNIRKIRLKNLTWDVVISRNI